MLTDEDRDRVACRCHEAICPLHNEASDGYVEHEVGDLLATVEAIVARHVTAALDMAANDPTLRLSGHSGVSITRLRQRAEKVRAAINPKETR